MNQFASLLDQNLDPFEQQKQAAKNLASVVRGSNLKWWEDKPLNVDKYVLVAVAVYSNYDLILLDFLNNGICSTPTYIANIDDCYHIHKVIELCKTPPICLLFKKNSIVDVKQSVYARDFIVDLFGLKKEQIKNS